MLFLLGMLGGGSLLICLVRMLGQEGRRKRMGGGERLIGGSSGFWEGIQQIFR